MELALAGGREYTLALPRRNFAGSVITLARQGTPNLSAYVAPEIALRLHKPHHAGIIVTSTSEVGVKELVEAYAVRFLQDFCAVVPPPDKPTS
jgi:hypothetical protein